MAHKYWHDRFLHKLLVPSVYVISHGKNCQRCPLQFATKFRVRTESGNEASLVYM